MERVNERKLKKLTKKPTDMQDFISVLRMLRDAMWLEKQAAVLGGFRIKDECFCRLTELMSRSSENFMENMNGR